MFKNKRKNCCDVEGHLSENYIKDPSIRSFIDSFLTKFNELFLSQIIQYTNVT